DQLARNGVELIRGRAAFVDPHVLSLEAGTGRKTVSAAHVLVAGGTRPAEPPGGAAAGATVLPSHSPPQRGTHPRPAVVGRAGGSGMGMEEGLMVAALDVQVTVVDKRPRPLEFVDHEIVDELIHQMRKRDVTFRCGDAVASIQISDGPPRRGVIELESGKH